MHTISQTEKTASDSERFGFVSAFVLQTAKKRDPIHGEPLKRSLQVNLQRILNRNYELAICSLRYSVRETQSAAAYLLLAEAYAQAGQTEMALATLDVLRCVEPDRSEAEMMKGFFRQEQDSRTETKKYFRTADDREGLCAPREMNRCVF